GVTTPMVVWDGVRSSRRAVRGLVRRGSALGATVTRGQPADGAKTWTTRPVPAVPAGSPQAPGRYCGMSENADCAGLRALGALGDVELHPLVLLQAAEPVRGDLGEVDENVLTATVDGDEAEALVAVEPL